MRKVNPKDPVAETLRLCIAESSRFLERARKALKEREESNEYTHYSTLLASAKRASMDLSRALAGLRRRPKDE